MRLLEVVELLGGVAILGAVFAYLGRVAIESFLNARLADHKAALDRATAEHSVRFQRLHAERADAIKALYEHVARLDETLASTLAYFQSVAESPLQEKVTTLAKQFNAVREYYFPRRIFFDEPTCALVEKILDAARGIFFDISTYEIDPQHPSYKYDPSLLKERHQFWQKARATHDNDFAPLKRALEDEFRKLLGIGA